MYSFSRGLGQLGLAIVIVFLLFFPEFLTQSGCNYAFGLVLFAVLIFIVAMSVYSKLFLKNLTPEEISLLLAEGGVTDLAKALKQIRQAARTARKLEETQASLREAMATIRKLEAAKPEPVKTVPQQKAVKVVSEKAADLTTLAPTKPAISATDMFLFFMLFGEFIERSKFDSHQGTETGQTPETGPDWFTHLKMGNCTVISSFVFKALKAHYGKDGLRRFVMAFTIFGDFFKTWNSPGFPVENPRPWFDQLLRELATGRTDDERELILKRAHGGIKN